MTPILIEIIVGDREVVSRNRILIVFFIAGIIIIIVTNIIAVLKFRCTSCKQQYLVHEGGKRGNAGGLAVTIRLMKLKRCPNCDALLE